MSRYRWYTDRYFVEALAANAVILGLLAMACYAW